MPTDMVLCPFVRANIPGRNGHFYKSVESYKHGELSLKFAKSKSFIENDSNKSCRIWPQMKSLLMSKKYLMNTGGAAAE